MNELSLFAGAGGGLLGTHLLGWRCVGAVEWESYPCSVLEARQRDGMLPYFPIFQTDIRDFVREGYARLYRGKCDIISAGFPCTPFSSAGKRLGEDDPRNMWPSTLAVIREVRPRSLLLENVPGLLTSGYFGTILGDLSDSGYDCRWRILSAAEMGAPHLRKRLWIVAHAHSDKLRPSVVGQDAGANRRNDISGSSAVAHTHSDNEQWGRGSDKMGGSGSESKTQKDGVSRRIEWPPEPDVPRVAHGIPNRVDRLTALGNAQVSIVAAAAWELLNEF